MPCNNSFITFTLSSVNAIDKPRCLPTSKEQTHNKFNDRVSSKANKEWKIYLKLLLTNSFGDSKLNGKQHQHQTDARKASHTHFVVQKPLHKAKVNLAQIVVRWTRTNKIVHEMRQQNLSDVLTIANAVTMTSTQTKCNNKITLNTWVASFDMRVTDEEMVRECVTAEVMRSDFSARGERRHESRTGQQNIKQNQTSALTVNCTHQSWASIRSGSNIFICNPSASKIEHQREAKWTVYF